MARIPQVGKFKFNDYDKSTYEVRDFGKAEPLDQMRVNFETMDEKRKKKYVDGIKAMIRKSLEYKKFISFLKDSLDMNECTFFEQINTKKRNIRIEIHHEPFTLTDLVYTAIQYTVDMGEEVVDFDIAQLVMYWHYCGLIGLIPLSKTVHELVHSGKVFIPLFFPDGDVVSFYTEYKKYMSDN
ncbi:hypothetical protein V6O07_11150, partial [Arthrospira platensis SPKY2]